MISVVIPVYNEAARLAGHVDVLRDVLTRAAGDEWEIVLVDDGSVDGTADVIRSIGSDEHVHGLEHDVNRGKGAAVRTGVLATRGDVILFCDADMSTPAETLLEFLPHLEKGADVVIGNRKSREATIERWQPPLRTWLGKGYTKLANIMLGLKLDDYTCGFKVFRGDAARRLFAALETERWSFDAEILARASREGLDIRQVPVHWHHEDDTRVRVLRDVIRSFTELLSIRRRLGRHR